MKSKKIIAVSMIGMNRSSQGDSSHPFAMEALEKKYAIQWLPQVSEREKKGSSLFYEHLRVIDTLSQDYAVAPEDIQCIFGRGTIGRSSERSLAEALESCIHKLGKDAFKVIIAKSYGVVDVLRALKRFGAHGEDIIGRINCLFCIDGYAPFFSRRSVSKKVRVGKKREGRLKIPPNIDKVYAIVQRQEGSKGLKAGKEGDPRIKNFVVKQPYVDSFNIMYDHYSDGYARELKVNHYNMDEIVSVIPCCREADASFCTMPEYIVKNYSTYAQA